MTAVDSGASTGLVGPRWCPVPISRITVPAEHETLDPAHVAAVRSSFEMLGGQLQLQPIVLDGELMLIDGAHRLEAARQAGWERIAALVFEGAGAQLRPILAAEANRVRKMLSVVELEYAWRVHYEPVLRAEARQRQLAGLRRRRAGSARTAQAGTGQAGIARAETARAETAQTGTGQAGTARAGTGQAGTARAATAQVETVQAGIPRAATGQTAEPVNPLTPEPANVIANTDNAVGWRRGDGAAVVNDAGPGIRIAAPRESLARAARRITGYSLGTLDKVAQIRRLAAAESAPAELREAAERGLQKLSRPGASVESVYRALQQKRQMLVGEVDPAVLRASCDERALERLLADTTMLAERLEGRLARQLSAAARRGAGEAEMLRGVRISLSHALAAIAAIECGLQSDPASGWQRIGQEINRLLSDAERGSPHDGCALAA